MLRWAVGYLAMAVVVAIGVASLQGSDRSERRSVSAATKQNSTSARSLRAHESEPENESGLDDGGYPEDEGYAEDGGYADEGYADEGYADEGYADEGYADEGYADEGYADEGYADEGYTEDEGDLEYVVQAGSGGHYLIEAVVNGAPVTFLVDTGASHVVLTMGDAERLGLHPSTLRFTQRFATANGEVRGAPVVLREIRIGQFSMFDLPASVNEAPLRVSLLGMSFLRRLNGYEVDDGRLILRW